HVSEGVPRGRSLRPRHEPAGVAVHDPPQHGAQPGPRSRPRRRERGQRPRRTLGRHARRRRRHGGVRDAGNVAAARRARAGAAGSDRRAAGGVPPGGLVTRRGRVFIRRNRWNARDSDRNRDVAHLARATVVVRTAASFASCPCLTAARSTRSSRRTWTASCPTPIAARSMRIWRSVRRARRVSPPSAPCARRWTRAAARLPATPLRQRCARRAADCAVSTQAPHVARRRTHSAPRISPNAPRAALRWLAPFALAASLVLLVGGAFVYQLTDRSATVMAAELV